MATGDSTFLDGVNKMFDQAVALLDLPDGLVEQIRAANSVYEVRFPVQTRRGWQMFYGWRATHSEHLLPVAGRSDQPDHGQAAQRGQQGSEPQEPGTPTAPHWRQACEAAGRRRFDPNCAVPASGSGGRRW